MSAIIQIMDKYSKKASGQLGIGFCDLKTGEQHFINGDTRFPSASTFKVPVLITLMNAVKEGRFTLDDVYTCEKSDISPGSGVLACLHPGVKMSLYDYAVLMMIVSDNTATDKLHNLVGLDAINKQIDALGLKNTRADLPCRQLINTLYGMPADATLAELRKAIDQEKIANDNTLYINFDIPNDFSSPRDMVTMFTKIYEKSIITPELCQTMMDIMAMCQTNSRIPYNLPHRGKTAPVIIHKTGTLEFVANDCGIVKTDKAVYILTMFYNAVNATEQEKATPHFNDFLLADISKEIFDAMHA